MREDQLLKSVLHGRGPTDQRIVTLEGCRDLRCAHTDVRRKTGTLEPLLLLVLMVILKHALLKLLECCDTIFSLTALLWTIASFEARVTAYNLA